MKRVSPCNHCGECCGGENPHGIFQPWPSNWPDAHDEWNQDSLQAHHLYKLIPHPHVTGHRSGTVDVDGTEFEYQWVPGIGLCKSETEHQCPFLLPYVDDQTGRCGVYGTTHHKIWEVHCSGFPPVETSVDTAIKILYQIPSCSHEYIEED